jgi:hypothetical protein
VTLNLAPPSGLFSAQSRPPWASTTERDTAKPIPMPFSLVVIKASKIRSGSSTPGPLSMTWINIPFDSLTARSMTNGVSRGQSR